MNASWSRSSTCWAATPGRPSTSWPAQGTRGPGLPSRVGQVGQVGACPQRRRGAVVDADPLEDAGEVRLHRALADAEGTGDLLVRQSTTDEGEHLLLPVGQLVRRRGG